MSPLSALRHFGKWIRFRTKGIIGARRLRRAIRSGKPLRIDAGSCGMCPQGWIETDIEFLNLLDPRDWSRFFSKDSIEAILAEHVWEHLTPTEGATAARRCFEYLAPGGWLRIAVPDGMHPDPAYLEQVREGGTGFGAADHKVLYTHTSLSSMLIDAGFEVDLLEYFDEGGSFHFGDWNPEDGMIRRSSRFDPRNRGHELKYTSLIVDARKPASAGPIAGAKSH
jgi:predicted SAM-dependent methyltransferase